MNKKEFDLDTLNKEHLILREELYQAKLDNKIELANDLETRISRLEAKIWKAKSIRFPELAEFSSLFEALQLTSVKLAIPFPEISYSRENQFLFSVSDNQRAMLIIPRENTGGYAVCLNDKQTDRTLSYRGDTEYLEQVVSVLSRWYVARDSISQICQDFSWISSNPVEIPI